MARYNAYAEIDLAALKHNFRIIKQLAGKRAVIHVVKADAYGHGAVKCASALRSEGGAYFAVANLDEAWELKNAGLDAPVLIFGYIPHERIEEAVMSGFRLTAYSMSFARAVSSVCSKRNAEALLHIKINTGMTRLGFGISSAAEKIARINGFGGITVEGVFTHFATADEADPTYADAQSVAFRALIKELKEKNICPPMIHMGNSAALIARKDDFTTAVRPGIIQYGIAPSETIRSFGYDFRPVMNLYTHIANIQYAQPGDGVSYGRRYVAARTRKIATLAAGYADGYPRSLSGKGEILISGKKARLTGTVCMDMMMADITDIAAEIGDKALLFGDGLPAQNVAALYGGIGYELTCCVTKRVPRVYTGA